jgi:uncharacterized protein (UPF0332 family)
MKFEEKFFKKFRFTREQVNKNYENASKDFDIARRDKITDVKFNYAYTALIKAGIALLSFHNIKIKSTAGHHIKTIEKLSEILEDEDIANIGNVMRSKRNLDLYEGGIKITEKECREYIKFVEGVLLKVKKVME